MFETRDLGAIPRGNSGLNYSSSFYRINDWYKAWLPDDAHIKQRHDSKTVYNVRIRYYAQTTRTTATILHVSAVYWSSYKDTLF